METKKVVLTKEDKRELWLSEARCPECGKPVMKPKDGGLGATCYEHQGKLRRNASEASAVPEGWLRMSAVCRKAVEQGITISALVTAAGGDAAVDPLLDPVFKVVYVGRGKYMNPEVLTKGFNLLKAKKDAPKEPKAEKKAEPGQEEHITDTATALKKAVIKK